MRFSTPYTFLLAGELEAHAERLRRSIKELEVVECTKEEEDDRDDVVQIMRRLLHDSEFNLRRIYRRERCDHEEAVADDFDAETGERMKVCQRCNAVLWQQN